MSNLRNTPVGSTVTVRKIEGEGATLGGAYEHLLHDVLFLAGHAGDAASAAALCLMKIKTIRMLRQA